MIRIDDSHHFEMLDPVQCPACRGDGENALGIQCWFCDGDGEVEEDRAADWPLEP